MREGPEKQQQNARDKSSKNISRREALSAILKGVGAGAAMVGTSYGIFKYQKFLDIFDHTTEVFEKEPAIHAAKEYLKTRYGMIVVSGDSWNPMHSGEQVDKEQYLRALAQLVRTMSKYPRSLFSEKGLVLRLVYNLKSLSIADIARGLGKSVDGQASGFFNTVVIDATTLVGSEGSMTVDHELYHLFDHRERNLHSNEWVHMHEKTCSCNPYGVRRVRKDPMTRMIDDVAFASEYGRTNEREDRATWAEVIMDPSRHRELRKRLVLPVKEFEEYLSSEGFEGTPHDAEKLHALTKGKYEAIRDDYERWSRGEMGSEYWERLLNQEDVPMSSKEEKIIDELMALRGQMLTSSAASAERPL